MSAELNSLQFTHSTAGDRAQLPWPDPPLVRAASNLIANAMLSRGPRILRVRPTVHVVDHMAHGAFKTNGRPLLDAAAAGGRTGRPIAQLPVVNGLFCVVCRQRVLVSDAGIFAFTSDQDLREMATQRDESWKNGVNWPKDSNRHIL